MHRACLLCRPLGLALLVLLPWGSVRAAEKPSKVTFDTGDGVTLQGTYYVSPKGKDEPAVLLLHKIGSDSHKDGWDSLADKLNDKGYTVLSFDFRGHGNSTAVDPKFWDYAYNAKATRGSILDPKTGKKKESINYKDFAPSYLPYLVNDVAAAKIFLDDRNDAGECNSHSVILIGAEDGAALGAMWMASEWSRYSATVNYPFGKAQGPIIRGIGEDPEGKDQYAAIWLSITPALSGKIGVAGALRSWITLAGKEHKVPMGFLFGDKDETGQRHAEEFIRILKGPDPRESKLAFTASQAIKDTKLTGSKLLHDSLDTEKMILTYLGKLRDSPKNLPHKWTKVDLSTTGYVWRFNPVRPPLPPRTTRGRRWSRSRCPRWASCRSRRFA